MKIKFTSGNPESVLELINEHLSGRKLGKIVKLELTGDELIVAISKLGTSKLHFDVICKGDDVRFNLAKEKIAMSHKALKGSVIEKFKKVIQACDGEIVEEYPG